MGNTAQTSVCFRAAWS